MISNLNTENRNKKTMDIDEMSIFEFIKIMNEEDQLVSLAVNKELSIIEEVIKAVVKSFDNGGRLIYIGAGTSGRLGILDAVECVPTFGIEPEQVQGLIAGGNKAIVRSVEGAEDSEVFGENDLKDIKLTADDIVIGIAASGRTPYVIGGLKYANELGAQTASLSCNKNSLISKISRLAIEVEVGPEVLTGSTRLKSGTAQKMVLNMISTAAMIAIGKTYGNLMVDVQTTNSKLVERAKGIIMDATNISYDLAEEYLRQSKNSPKIAIVMIKSKCSYDEAVDRLNKSNGFVKKAIGV